MYKRLVACILLNAEKHSRGDGKVWPIGRLDVCIAQHSVCHKMNALGEKGVLIIIAINQGVVKLASPAPMCYMPTSTRVKGE